MELDRWSLSRLSRYRLLVVQKKGVCAGSQSPNRPLTHWALQAKVDRQGHTPKSMRIRGCEELGLWGWGKEWPLRDHGHRAQQCLCSGRSAQRQVAFLLVRSTPTWEMTLVKAPAVENAAGNMNG